MSLIRRLASLALLLALALAWPLVRADTPVKLFKSFAGNVNFVGTQITIRKSDKKPCDVFNSNSTRTASLSGIPAGAEILSAHLYWAGSGYNPDYTISLDNVSVAAANDRRYYSTTIGGNHNYFSGAADVTAQVKIKRNSTYHLRGLSVEDGSPYCGVEGVLGGFALLVIYSDVNEPLRMLNLYEGFQYMRYGGLTLNLGNFRIPQPLGGATGRIAHITWEGDETLQQYGEKLTFNNYEMTDSMNPSENQFNSRSNINGDGESHGIDFDAYTIGSPVIQGGQTTATARYESGQDMVLLSAEIVALPNVPVADLSITKMRNNELTLGQNVGYTINVANNGPGRESGPVVVTDVLPAGLAYVSGAGTGWVCGNTGQTVTCSYAGSLAAGASLPALVITARVTAGGTITNSATVTGKMFDNIPENNTGSATGTVSASQAFVFTNGPCVDGKAFGDAGQTCSTMLSSVKAGTDRTIYITVLVGGVPAKLSPSKDTDVSMQFALSCHNPRDNAGVQASYAGVTLPLCMDGGKQPTQWSASKNIRIPGGMPSAAATFRYNDVGQVQLFMRTTSNNVISTGIPFVSVPYEIRLTRTDGSDFAALPADDNAAVFAKAGAAFAMSAGGYTAGGALTPNLGREQTKVGFKAPAVEVGAQTTPGQDAMTSLPALDGEFGAISGGRATGAAFSWNEVGIVKLTPVLNTVTYLGETVTARATFLGRFIPDHFDTAAAEAMDCTPNMQCAVDLPGAAYSGQPFETDVTARSASGLQLANYQGPFAKNVVLMAYDQAGGAAANPAGGALSGQQAASTAFSKGAARLKPAYALPNPFADSAPQARNWTAPTSIYLRAEETAGGDGVTSKRPSNSEEGGIRIVSGRLLVPNAYGSERLNLPLRLAAQYWTGSNWETSRTDNVSAIDPAPAKIGFSNYGGSLQAGMLSLQPLAVQALVLGQAGFTIKAPGVAGSVDLLINQLAWLPSTKGRLKFGVFKSPLIYLREAY